MSDIEGRIFFPGNPWPEGHPLKTFEWTARIVGDDLWFDFHLMSQDYYAERDIEEAEGADYDSDWQAPAVWDNYHRCILSSTYWGEIGGFRVCRADEFSPEWLDGRIFEVDRFDLDPMADEIDDDNEHPFHLYLLGHDSVVGHRIGFVRAGDGVRFDIHWAGRIALSYTGSYMPKHAFEAFIPGVPCPPASTHPGTR